MECDFNLLCYGLFKSQKLFNLIFFWWYFLYVLQHYDEIGNGKKCYFQYHLNIHILSQFSTTLEKDFEKGF
jgi:hypothetical protein